VSPVGARARLQRARVGLPRGDRARRRRGRDGGVLARVPALTRRARPHRRAARRLRRPRRSQEGDRPGARLPPGSAAAFTFCARRSATSAGTSRGWSPPCCAPLRRRQRRGRSSSSATRSGGSASRSRRWRRSWRRPRRTCSPSTPSPSTTRRVALHQPALERVNREIGRRTDVVGHLPQGPLADPARRQRRDRAERRVARRPPLPQQTLPRGGPRPREERKTTTERRPASARAPTILPTSYTTSWDLTREWGRLTAGVLAHRGLRCPQPRPAERLLERSAPRRLQRSIPPFPGCAATRRMRTRMSGGVGGAGVSPAPYPILTANDDGPGATEERQHTP
jgi:hypothetical protein